MTGFEDTWARQFGVRRPGQIVCVGRNYAAHAAEEGADLPKEPLLFAKLGNTVIGPGEPILLPAVSSHVDAEAELALVISTTARAVSAERARALLRTANCAILPATVTAEDRESRRLYTPTRRLREGERR